MKTTAIVFFSLMFFLISVVESRGNSPENVVLDVDILVYSVFDYDDGTTLYLYDTSSDESRILYQDNGRLHFVFGSNGYIVFSREWIWENNGELFILDIIEVDQPLINLSQEIGMVGYPLGWSNDGNYLAFASEIDGGQQQAIYIWDGTTTNDISPQNTFGNPHSFDVAWSLDGRLAFTAWFANHESRSEIYIWDGEATYSLSQNAGAEDREPVWNTSDELVFGSTLDNEYILLVWDGTSYVDDLPDVSSFTRIAPELNIYSPYSTWINDDLLAFQASGPDDSFVQIYTWDGQIWSNISQNLGVNTGIPEWSQNGYWAFATEQGRIYVRNEHNDTVFETRGQYKPAWSSGENLIFCSRNSTTGWKLSQWNGASVSTLVEGDEIFAQWQSGQTTVCSDG